MNTHVKRWLTAVVIVPVLFSIIAWGTQALFFALILAAVILGVREYNTMVFVPALQREKLQTLLIALLIPMVFYWGSPGLSLAAMAFSTLVVSI